MGVLQRLDVALDVVLVLQARGRDLELQRTDRAEDRLATPRRRKQHLHQPLFLELANALVELLEANVAKPGDAEVFGRKPGNRRIVHRRARVQRVSNSELPRD